MWRAETPSNGYVDEMYPLDAPTHFIMSPEGMTALLGEQARPRTRGTSLTSETLCSSVPQSFDTRKRIARPPGVIPNGTSRLCSIHVELWRWPKFRAIGYFNQPIDGVVWLTSLQELSFFEFNQNSMKKPTENFGGNQARRIPHEHDHESYDMASIINRQHPTTLAKRHRPNDSGNRLVEVLSEYVRPVLLKRICTATPLPLSLLSPLLRWLFLWLLH
jgi:hypothetical protein